MSDCVVLPRESSSSGAACVSDPTAPSMICTPTSVSAQERGICGRHEPRAATAVRSFQPPRMNEERKRFAAVPWRHHLSLSLPSERQYTNVSHHT